MTEPTPARTGARQPATSAGYGQRPAARTEPANLADILERVLDKGVVIAGDIKVNLLDIELLTIKLRLVVASVERAREMGIDWWEHDPTLSSAASTASAESARSTASAVTPEASGQELEEENRRLRERIAALESGTTQAEGSGLTDRGGRESATSPDRTE